MAKKLIIGDRSRILFKAIDRAVHRRGVVNLSFNQLPPPDVGVCPLTRGFDRAVHRRGVGNRS
uniref:hypothetical protein n=1 Tax=Endozoicomonas acroporae TaxID=1701104 RepID=UPI0019D59AFC